MTPAAPTSLARQIVDEARPLLARLREAWLTRLHGLGVSLTHHQVLSFLDHEGELAMGALADRLGVSLPSASGIVDRLVEHDLVTRRRDEEDRRVVLVRLAPGGERLIRETHAVKRAELRRVIDRLDPEQQARLLRCIHDLRDAAGEPAQRGAR